MAARAEDPDLKAIANLWNGYLKTLADSRGPHLILNAADISQLLALREIIVNPPGYIGGPPPDAEADARALYRQCSG